ncbi:probable inactive peptidyl-prolyl cis-trans isomerase-like 6 isoform X4 [Ovis canadensis]|uniref:probable inactive peptidyl-prolyl cis-trans isomerase-like 6 isoform X4 n=1 Tax=Ovis canadensis TaxID=37174 RepID=UPI003750CA1C
MASQQQSVPCISRSPPEQPLQVKVVGLFKSSSFQIAKSAAEELKNEVWEYSSYVMCFINDKLLGDALDLQKWAHKVWDIVDFKPPALYEALTVDYSAKFLRDTKHNFVFLDISIDLYPIGRLIFEILCTGKAGFSQSGIKLHYTGSIFHRVVRNGWVQGGDIVAGKGDNGESIYGPTFEDENFSVPHNKRGVLGMVNKGRHSNGSQFYITLQAAPYLDKKYVAFGQLIEGTDVLHHLESVPTENERPIQNCLHCCGDMAPSSGLRRMRRKRTACVTPSVTWGLQSITNVCSGTRQSPGSALPSLHECRQELRCLFCLVLKQ